MSDEWIGKRVKVFELDDEGDPTEVVAAIGTVRDADEHHGLGIEPDAEWLNNVVVYGDGLMSAETRSVEVIDE